LNAWPLDFSISSNISKLISRKCIIEQILLASFGFFSSSWLAVMTQEEEVLAVAGTLVEADVLTAAAAAEAAEAAPLLLLPLAAEIAPLLLLPSAAEEVLHGVLPDQLCPAAVEGKLPPEAEK
jgi:hypothetical protein